MPVFISHKKQDSLTAQYIQRVLTLNDIESYLDITDPESMRTDNITEVITRNIKKSTHLIAVISDITQQSWWVPFEIGEATIAEKRIATYRIGNVKLPEYLENWPAMRRESELDLFINAYREERKVGNERFATNRQGIFESVNQGSSGADAFHRNLKQKLAQSRIF
ncbi:TIR domain-containing protein [Aeromonas enteropelogenes]|uniref:TIR domain-containing protein n=1 Tax=Aeromonas enteropelogenes TaxID=29489 RepID=UPI0038D0D149